jgi:hypothetical protein
MELTMQYEIISEREICGKQKGEILTDIEITDAGTRVEALINGGSIKPITKQKKDEAAE